jgi:O-succinylbenzoate synthase
MKNHQENIQVIATDWLTSVVANRPTKSPNAEVQIALVDSIRSAPSLIEKIENPILQAQKAALFSLKLDTINSKSISRSLSLNQLERTPELFCATALNDVKPGLYDMINKYKNEDHFGDLLNDFLESDELVIED